MKTIIQGGLTMLLSLLLTPGAKAQDWPITSVNSSSALWPNSALNDGNFNTQWSSQGYSDPNHIEWISYTLDAFRMVNYIKLYPRIVNGVALGFPKSFNIYWSNGAQWNLASTYTNFTPPIRSDFVILPLPSVVSTNNLHIVATTLGKDDYTNYFFQLGEVGAGYSVNLSKLTYVGNSGAGNSIEVRNVGSTAFDPNKAAVWNYDVRNPIIDASNTQPNPACTNQTYHGSMDMYPTLKTLRNIYAPSVIKTGVNSWRIFYGGYDNICQEAQADRIYKIDTNDGFESFTGKTMVLDSGSFAAINNPSVVQDSAQNLKMIFTSCIFSGGNNYCGSANKPGRAASTNNGATWSPSPPTPSGNATNMSGYANWGGYTSGEDVNSTNALLLDNGTYYMYWKGGGPTNYFATSTDGINFNHGGTLLTSTTGEPNELGRCLHYGVYDAKKINGQYVWTYHYNCDKVFWKTSPWANSWITSPTTLFETRTSYPALGTDLSITSPTLVTDGIRLLGIMYGANKGVDFSPPGTGAWGDLWRNKIYARWLQKKATISNSFVSLNQTMSRGPDNSVIKTDSSLSIETGVLRIYDTDGITLLYTSPPLTFRAGDIWRYAP